MLGEAELIMFAIRIAIKLGQQAREAYVDSTRSRELVLPLPNFPTELTIDDAGGYFVGQEARHVQRLSRLADLVDKWRARTLSTEDARDLMVQRTEFFVLDLADAGLPVIARDATGSVFKPEDLRRLFAIRQWRHGTDPSVSVLQRIGGALIEVGVDYFANVPGALVASSTQGKLVHALLAGLESVKVSEVHLGELPGRLFVATLESVSSNPALLTGDPKLQELVKTTGQGLTRDVEARIASMRAEGTSNSSREQRLTEWGELVFRSILNTGGRMVLEDPKTFLGIDATGEAALVSEVGKGVLGLVLDKPDGDLSRVFSREGVDTVIKAALIAVTKHPEILVDAKDEGVRALLVSVASELGQFDTLLSGSVLPEVTRLILEKTGENLELLWPDRNKDPRKHLLLTAAKTSLAILSKPTTQSERWKPAFARADLLAVTTTVFDELVQNPAWLVDTAGRADATLKAALQAAVDVLRARGTTQLSSATAAAVLQAAIRAVALRAGFLERMPDNLAAAAKPVLSAALDAMLATIFDQPSAKTKWRLTRADAVLGIVQIGLGELARLGPSPERVVKLEMFLRDQAVVIEADKAWDLTMFAEDLRIALGGQA
jgi:hypothetical protein